MLKAIFTEVRKINIFGRNLQLEKDYVNKFNSIQSFILSFLVFIATIVVGFLIGEEIYKKERPKVTISTAKIDPDESELNFSEFPIILTFTNNLALPISSAEFKKLLSLQVIIFSIDETGLHNTLVDFDECNPDNISGLVAKEIMTERMKLLAPYQNFCFNPKWKIKNKAGLNHSTYISITVNRCQSDCHENLVKMIDGIMGTVSLINSFIDPSSFNSPIKFYEYSQTFVLNSKIQEQIFFSFTKNNLITNVGWIFDSYEKKSYFSFSDMRKSFFVSDYTFSNLVFESPTVVTQTSREYMKIQELIASIGGFFNACYIILDIIFGHYIKFDYYCYIDNKTRYLEEENQKVISKKIDFKSQIKVNNYVNLKKKIDCNVNNHSNQDIYKKKNGKFDLNL